MLEGILSRDEMNETPLYMQLYKQIKEEIMVGNIKSGSKLPSIRNLANGLKVSKNTVEVAYEQLIAEGYVKSKNRSGLYVENLIDAFELLESTPAIIKSQREKPVLPPVRYDFRSGQIDTASFPFKQYRKILSSCIDEGDCDLLLYGDQKGDSGLRVEIAKYIHAFRGVNCSPDQIILSSGTQQSLSLFLSLLSDFERIVAIEDPGYCGVKAVLHDFGFQMDPIPLEEDGIDLSYLNDRPARLVYVTPSHQYPYGMVMSIQKRLKLLQWAKKRDAYILEDDYDGEFRYRGKPIPSLQSLDDCGHVVYLGNFTKSLMPSLRVSYLVLPKKLLPTYEARFDTNFQPVSRILQKSLEIFIREGLWEKHLRKMRVLYKKKQDLLLSAIAEVFEGKVTVIGAEAGLHILLEVHTSKEEAELIQRAEVAGIRLKNTTHNWINPPKDKDPVIFIGFAGMPLEIIPEGIKALKKCWFD